MRDRDGEALSGRLDDVLLQPVRTAFGVGRDDDLVRAEQAERVLHRLQRLRVADLAPRVDPAGPQALQARVEPLLRLHPRVVLVGGPVAKRRVQRRGDDEHLLVVALRAAVDLVTQALAAHGLVGDHEDATLVLTAAAPGHRLPRRLVPPRAHDVRSPREREREKHDDPGPLPDRERGDRDRREVPHRQQKESIRLGLAAQRVDHRPRGCTPSCTRQSTLRRRSANRSRKSPLRGVLRP